VPKVEDSDSSLAEGTISRALSHLPRSTEPDGEPAIRVLIFDQFEELFSTYEQYWQHRKGFFEQIAEALKVDSNLRALFILREDYLARFMEFAPLLPESARTRYPLERLRREQALSAITKPLVGTRWSFADGVPEELVTDLTRINIESQSGEIESVPGEFVEPVQLQVVCYSLLERLPDDKTVITLEDLHAFGNPDEALQLFYETAIDSTVRSQQVDEEELRTWFEARLITPSGTRGLVFQSRDGSDGISNNVIAALETQHLIRPEIRSGSRWYELTHDRFIRPIQKSNLAWRMLRWSESFEPAYNAAIKTALAASVVSEETLRRFLDSMVSLDGSRLTRLANPNLKSAMQILVEAKLLLRRTDAGRSDVTYTPLNDTIAQAIQRSNQNWRARIFAGARELRRLESRASRWYRRRTDNKNDLLLSSAELEKAKNILRSTEVAGVRVSTAFFELVAESERVLRSKSQTFFVRFGVALSLVSLVLACGLLYPGSPPVSKAILFLVAPSIAGIVGAFLSVATPLIMYQSEFTILTIRQILARLLIGLVVGGIAPLLTEFSSFREFGSSSWKSILIGFLAGGVVPSSKFLDKLREVFETSAVHEKSIRPTSR
jgi:hypothetical protein